MPAGIFTSDNEISPSQARKENPIVGCRIWLNPRILVSRVRSCAFNWTIQQSAADRERTWLLASLKYTRTSYPCKVSLKCSIKRDLTRPILSEPKHFRTRDFEYGNHKGSLA